MMIRNLTIPMILMHYFILSSIIYILTGDYEGQMFILLEALPNHVAKLEKLSATKCLECNLTLPSAKA